MSSFSVLQKQKYCDELEEFTENTEKYLRETCSYLDWDFDNIDENDKFIICPFNKAHRVSPKNIGKHLEKCEWKILGYTKDCVPFPDPTLLPNNPSTIKFDIELQHKILQTAKQKNPELNIGVDEKLIPQTSDRLLSDFTNDERKAMYEYVISNTIAPDIGQDITDINKLQKQNKQNTPIVELLAQERNLKRRRTKHRGVHTNKKSHTEILRELVQQQMEIFKEHISEKFVIPISGRIEENNHSKNTKNEITINKVSINNFSKNDEKDLFDNSQFNYYKSKNDSKGFNEKSKKNIKYDKDDDTSNKHSSDFKSYNYKKTSKSKNLQNFVLKHEYYNKYKYEFSEKDNRQNDIQYKINDKKNICIKNYDCTTNSYLHKHNRSRSSEKKYRNSRSNSQEKKQSKVKKKKESYFYDTDEHKCKNFMYK